MNQDRYRWTTTAILLAFILGAFSATQTACPGPEQRIFKPIAEKLQAEPRLSVYIKETGQKKDMSIEEYLAGVVAGEMRPGWTKAAYAAQAIVARTFTMEFLARGGTRKIHGTDISTDEKEAQAYNAKAITPIIKKAVLSTKGQVMVYKGRYVHGWFSASCGGRTVPAKIGLAYKEAEPPYITSVTCSESKVIPKSEQFWSTTFTLPEVQKAFTDKGKQVGTVQKLAIGKKDPKTKRAVTLVATGTAGKTTIPAADFRTAVGPEKMRSIWLLSLTQSSQGIAIKGRGFGHGVGLCQWGAYALAKSGQNPIEIVKHYYPKVKIMDLW
ncbi:MAG TPA: SpoIID/LytB domain-containing protein [Bacillota bacterium]|nr:SpoIID/LytB domain-containing protein [Bacillota bacterium]